MTVVITCTCQCGCQERVELEEYGGVFIGPYACEWCQNRSHIEPADIRRDRTPIDVGTTL